MQMEVISSHCPVQEATQETFVEHVMVGGEMQRMTFAKEVKWLQMSASTAALWHGGVQVVELADYDDAYGYLSSISSDVSDIDLAAAAGRFGITRESSLELRLTCTVFLQPVVETEEHAAHNRTRRANEPAVYSAIPRNWLKELTEEGGEPVQRNLESVNLHAGVVWSSKNTAAENAALLADFRQQHAIPKERPNART